MTEPMSDYGSTWAERPTSGWAAGVIVFAVVVYGGRATA
jgi:hypothetical protein